MPSFFRFSSSRIFAAAGTGALLVLVVILITGGFVVDAGPLHFSARRVAGPLVLAIAGWAIVALRGGKELAESAAAISHVVDRHATALALVIAAAAAGTGVAYGTYSASGSDASGYVSQAALLASGRFAEDQPLARVPAWRHGTAPFAALGYRAGQRRGELVPTYPSGLPLVMAASWRIGGTFAPFLVSPLLGALAVFCTYLLGARLRSRTAGIVAAALLGTSPIFLLQIVQPMSDVPVTAWWALAVVLALSPAAASPVAAGIATGLALITRPNLLPLAVVPALLTGGWLPPASRRQPRGLARLVVFALATAPVAVVQLLLQWRAYGTPLASGYGPVSDLFAAAYIWPNVRGYGWRLLTGETPALMLAAVSLIAIAPVQHRNLSTGLSGVSRLWLLVFCVVLGCYLPYVAYPEWAYLRFLLPALPLTFVLIASLLTTAVTTLPVATRGVVLLVVVTIAGSLNVVHASGEQAFNMRRYDARYRSTGRYLEAALLRNAVVLAAQESGSARHYSRLPIVRWDLIDDDLDGAINVLRALGRHPVLLVEDWERADFAARFTRSRLALLDWRPLAIIGDTTQVLLLDPLDAERTSTARATDRVH
jgi:hypothetical protein